MANNANAVIGEIEAIQAIADNFPMSLLSLLNTGKKYDSVIDLLLDILDALGYDLKTLVAVIIGKIFNVNLPNPYNISDAFAGVDNINSKTLQGIEDAVKIALIESLTAILGCNINCEIPNWYMDSLEADELNGMKDLDKTASGSCGNIKIPVSLIDVAGKFNICPATTMGFNYYNMGNDVSFIGTNVSGETKTFDTYNKAWKFADKDETRVQVLHNWTANNLYKTQDLDAFLWYVINRGVLEPQREKNKMVWDTRITLANHKAKKKASDVSRSNNEEWDYWLNSKKSESGVLCGYGATEYNNNQRLKPIMQLGVDSGYTTEPVLTVALSAQNYYRGFPKGKSNVMGLTNLMYNKSIYSFNYDYVRNIQIFNYKQIFTQLINYIVTGNFINDLKNSGLVQYNFTVERINAELERIIDNIITVDDTTVSDCYFKFSNDDLDAMLRKSELNRFGARMRSNDCTSANKYDAAELLSLINKVNNSVNQEELLSTITRTINDAYVGGNPEGDFSISANFSIDTSKDVVKKIIIGIITPIVYSVLTPKVILLYIINFQIMGLMDFSDIDKIDKEKLMELLYEKIFVMLSSIIKYIKDVIVQIILNVVFEAIKPILEKVTALLGQELISDWINILNKALQCVPYFDINKYVINAGLDEVHYADIAIPEQIIPEKETNC